VIHYRTFRNCDPPRILELWETARLGRGAAGNLRCDAFEALNFAQPYFDPEGLILACDGDRNDQPVGFAHAGFAVNEGESELRTETGVVAAVIVHPECRRRGIGRELVRRAEDYLRSRGANTIFAGQAEPLDPFYFGLYGGSQPSGFLESDPEAAPFFRAIGYVPFERHAVFQRDLTERNDPMTMRLAGIRRKTQLAIAHQRGRPSWWWITRLGRLDSVRFQLVPKSDGGRGEGETIAGVTVLGLDLYLDKWQERAVGLYDLFVEPEQRQEGHGQALLVEVCRRMRDEMVTRIEAHAAESNTPAVAALKSAGFEQIDTGVVYQLIEDDESRRQSAEEFQESDTTVELSAGDASEEAGPSDDTTVDFKIPRGLR
jgi:ribosomal protein S18 acetylase RimI-like enzyme